MKKITFGTIGAGVAIVALALGMLGCAGNENALKGGKVALSAYETVQQGMLIYGGLDTCPKSKPICKDQVVWDRLKAADLVATTAIVEATPVLNGTDADLGQALKAYEAIEAVKDAFIEANAKLKAQKAAALVPATKPMEPVQ